MSKIKKIILLIVFISSINFSLATESVYDLEINFENADGKKINMKDLKGNIQVLSMIYTRCKTICPVIINNMKKIEQEIIKNKIKNVKFTLITLDPENDKTEQIKNFVKEKKINNWEVLRTSKEDTLKIAMATGIRYKKENSDEYTHSNIIIVIGKNGDIKIKHPGLEKNYKKIIKIINESCKE